MKVAFACAQQHEEPVPLPAHAVRAELEHGRCPVCTGQTLDGEPRGGLEWARCPCCEARWRLEDEGFAVRSGGLVEEWA
jgi:formate dehydrogenase maturation protein FdhE